MVQNLRVAGGIGGGMGGGIQTLTPREFFQTQITISSQKVRVNPGDGSREVIITQTTQGAGVGPTQAESYQAAVESGIGAYVRGLVGEPERADLAVAEVKHVEE